LWRVPKDFKGGIRIEAKLNPTLYEVKQDEKVYALPKK